MKFPNVPGLAEKSSSEQPQAQLRSTSLCVANILMSLYENENVKDFKISPVVTNVSLFDDVVSELEVETYKEKRFYGIFPTHITKVLNVTKWFKSFQNLKKTRSNYALIVIADTTFDISWNSQVVLQINNHSLHTKVKNDVNGFTLPNIPHILCFKYQLQEKKIKMSRKVYLSYKRFFDSLYIYKIKSEFIHHGDDTFDFVVNKYNRLILGWKRPIQDRIINRNMIRSKKDSKLLFLKILEKTLKVLHSMQLKAKLKEHIFCRLFVFFRFEAPDKCPFISFDNKIVTNIITPKEKETDGSIFTEKSKSESPSRPQIDPEKKIFPFVEMRDNRGITVLHTACEMANFSYVEELFKGGAQANTSDFEGNTALHYVSLSLSRNEELKKIIDLIVDEHKFNINTQNKDGATALHLACESANYVVAKKLVDVGADVYYVDEKRNTVLHYASRSLQNNEEIIHFLLIKGVDVNAQNNDGTTALQFACLYGNYDNVKELIKILADVEAVDNKRRNALHYASLCFGNNSRIIQLLIDEGIDGDDKDEDGITPRQLAHKNRRDQNEKKLFRMVA